MPPLGVARPVKAAVRLVKSGFEHIENALMPCHDFVTVAVFDRRTPKPVDLRYLIRTKTVTMFTEQLRRVVGANVRHECRTPHITERFDDVSL